METSEEEESSERQAYYVDATTDSSKEDCRYEIERTHQTPFEDYFDALMKLSFSPTTFADENVLREMGIYNNVHSIFSIIGLGDLPFRTQPRFRELSCEFLASVQTYFHPCKPKIKQLMDKSNSQQEEELIRSRYARSETTSGSNKISTPR